MCSTSTETFLTLCTVYSASTFHGHGLSATPKLLPKWEGQQEGKRAGGQVGAWMDRQLVGQAARQNTKSAGDVDEQMSGRVRAGSLGMWASRDRAGKGANGQLNG